LLVFLVPITFAMHPFWNIGDPLMHHVQQAMFVKNLSMMGATLLLIYWVLLAQRKVAAHGIKSQQLILADRLSQVQLPK
jgi:hypothetical protein